MNRFNRNFVRMARQLILLTVVVSFVFTVNRNGTTTANFLEIDIGSSATAMGGAYVSVVDDVSAVFWNPAGLSNVTGNEVMFMYQPWIIGIDHVFVGAAVKAPSIGTFALSLNFMNYGDEAVTTVAAQEGTGELYAANDYSIGLSFARKIVNWFSFGVSAKLISSSIWHMKASAAAVDLGVIINSKFLVPNEDRTKGLKIGMSISNYGSRMRYDGIDLLNPIDITDDHGNFENVPGIFKTESWELPLLFRIGISFQPVATDRQNLIVALDALHPNNNTESINIGTEYEFIQPGVASYFLRAGYKGKYMVDSEYGLTFGGGIKMRFAGNQNVIIDYSYKTMGRLGNVHLYTVGLEF
ncbi:MAG: PorV/PorQ family protein [Candidatus Marinimicrobia bacterium]|nr:PorV/PorQ family protein [Candidatus Neomarinimicrobiota bacterium]